MKKKAEIKRKRILLYYALAIVLPCLILGILALRGIKNDQALVEREQRRDLLESGQKIIEETDKYLSFIETGFAENIDSAAIPDKTIFNDVQLKRFVAENPAIAGIFFRLVSGEHLLLNSGLLYVPDDLSSISDVTGFQVSGRNLLEKGWQIEFREKDLPKALRYYQNIIQDITGDQFRGEILNAVARLQKKLNLNKEAIETYDLIWKEYPQILIQNRIPLGAVALIEKSYLKLTLNDTASALKNVHILIDQMKIPAWQMAYSDFAGFSSKIDEILTLCNNSHRKEISLLLEKISALKDGLSLTEKHTEYLLAFLENSGNISVDAKPAQVNDNYRKRTQINGQPYLISLVNAKDECWWGLILDLSYILNNAVYQSIIKNADESYFSWEISDVNGDFLLKSESIPESTGPVNVVFPSNLPSWSLILYPENSGALALFIRSGEGIFLYIFIAIVIILAFGLFFTIQTVNNELHLSKMKSYFISTVSHEFKSPLTSIRQIAEMLVHGRVPTEERQMKYFNTILQQSERLSHLIDNIIDFSKMEEGQRIFHFEKSNLIPVIKDAIESFRELTAKAGFHISLDISGNIPEIVFDRDAMVQVLHNLLDNAIKYSGESKEIEVQLFSKDDHIVIGVRDYGIGISKEDHDKIFSRFYRAGDELTQTVKGSGIGLTIVKQIVEAHKGTIDVVSEIGKGSIFSVKLPI